MGLNGVWYFLRHNFPLRKLTQQQLPHQQLPHQQLPHQQLPCAVKLGILPTVKNLILSYEWTKKINPRNI